MTTLIEAGTSAAACATQAPTTPPAHYLRRVARLVLIRAAVRGRISWLVCFRMLVLIEPAAPATTKREV